MATMSPRPSGEMPLFGTYELPMPMPKDILRAPSASATRREFCVMKIPRISSRTDHIEKILGMAGLDPNREIIVYGSRGTWNPYFGLYTLRYFGGSNVRVYHEGIEDWAAADRPISRDASQLPLVALKLEINSTVAVTTKEMVARLNNPDLQILDVRTPQEFIGEDIRA